jgi:glycine hydroxymethyltransferase
MQIIAAKAVAFHEALQPEFAEYQRNVIDNAFTLGEELKKGGFKLVSGGTDTHLLLVKLLGMDINGRKAEEVLGKAGIVANREPIPFDPLPPLKTSGVRFGTPALTTRGMGKDEMKQVAGMITRVLKDSKNSSVLNKVKNDVLTLCARFPVPGFTG